MAYDTNNPVGSTDPRDLYDNAGNLDKFVNGEQPFYPDRLGKQRISWSGIEADVESAFEGWEAQFQAFLQASAYEPPVSYAAGVTLERITQTVVRDDIQYRFKDPELLPYTITGNWATEEEKFVVIGDSALRQDLMLGTSQIVSPEAVSYTNNGSTASLKVALDALFKGEGLHPSMFGISPGDDVAALLNTIQYPFDLRGDSYTLSAGVSRTASLFNGTLQYSGAAPSTPMGGIVEFHGALNIDARRLYVIYSGTASGVRGIVGYGDAHHINLRGAYAEGTTGAGIRLQRCNDADLTGAGAYDCMRDAIGSTDVGLAYGAIHIGAITPGSAEICHRAILKRLYIRTQSTGLSVMAGENHEISWGDIRTIDPATASSVSMGVYCGGLLKGIGITYNRVEGFMNEGIDVHNTGTGAVPGIRGVYIAFNTVINNSYKGISAVADSQANAIEDVTIVENVVSADPGGRMFGHSGGVVCEFVSVVKARGNRVNLDSATPAAQSYAYSFSSCSFVYTDDNMASGAWNRVMPCSGYRYWRIAGLTGSDIASGQDGVLITQTIADAVHSFTGISLREAVAGSGYAIRQSSSSITLSNFNMNGCSINGRISITNFSSGVVAGNNFVNYSGTLACSGTGVIIGNSGFLNSFAGTTLGTLWGAMPVVVGGQTKYIPLYNNFS